MISFFCKTYSRELEIAAYAAKSINRFCQAPYEIVMVVDNDSEKKELASRLGNVPHSIYVHEDFGAPRVDGYIDQQCIKLSAHRFCKYDNIFFFDSDMMFWTEFDMDAFTHHGRIVLPYADWPRLPFFSANEVRAIQVAAGRDIFFLGDLENFLRKLSRCELSALGYDNFLSNEYSNALVRRTGDVIRWQTNYPDLLWSLSSRFGANLCGVGCYYDTMREHYMVSARTLRNMERLIGEKYGSIWQVAYNRSLLPVFSEFQILGNFIMASHFDGGGQEYFPLPVNYLYHSSNGHPFGKKIIAVKWNSKNHPIPQFGAILNGELSHCENRRVARSILGRGWN